MLHKRFRWKFETFNVINYARLDVMSSGEGSFLFLDLLVRWRVNNWGENMEIEKI